MHDIGRLAIPADILTRPLRLTGPETDLVRTHAEVSRNILANTDFGWPLAEAVWQRHERLDGSGYPRGLRGDELLLEARALAVADTVEAMSSHRPFRPALGLPAALDEVRNEAGALYDPEVVAACGRAFAEGFMFVD